MDLSGYIKNIRKKVGHDRVIVAGAGVFIYKDSKVLLQKRKDNSCWAMHGGGIEIGEKVEEAVKRELLEETGLIANDLELLGIFSGENMLYTYPNGDEVYVIAISYVCRDFSGEMLLETDETNGLNWFDINNIPDNINPPDIEPLKAFLKYVKATAH